MAYRRAAWVGLALGAGLAAWPAFGQQAGPASAAPGDTVHEVTIQHHRFTPATLQVRAGDRVRWVNRETRTTHTVLFIARPAAQTGTGADEGPTESDRLFPGEAHERRFERPGRYPYLCGPHPEMQGLIEVLP